MNTTAQTNKPTTLAIDGMTCGHCVRAVTKALSAVPGVKVRSVTVGSAVVEAADSWTAKKAVAALEEAGYPAKAVGDAASSSAPSPAKDGVAAMPGGKPGAEASGGCCG